MYDDGKDDVVFALAGFYSPSVFLFLEVADNFDFFSGGGVLEVDVEDIEMVADFLEVGGDAVVFDDACFFEFCDSVFDDAVVDGGFFADGV